MMTSECPNATRTHELRSEKPRGDLRMILLWRSGGYELQGKTDYPAAPSRQHA